MADSNAIQCISQKSTSLNFSGNTPITGQTWVVSVSGKYNSCFTITSLTNNTGSTDLLLSATTDCLDCFNNETVFGLLDFKSCFGVTYTVLIKDISFLPVRGDFYYINIVNSLGENVQTCVEATENLRFISEEDFTVSFNLGKIFVFLEDPTPYTNCQVCLSSNTTTYSVRNCATNSTDYISVPPGITLSDKDLITYTIGADQYCGTKANTGTTTPTGVFVSNLGTNVPEINDCITCLSGVAEKRIISRCGEPEIQEVVWNSLLNEIGTSTNLSNSEGCWEIGELTTSAVTLTGFLNFDPQPDCEQCVQCNGIYYNVETSCGESRNLYIIRTNEYVSGGTRFYIPNSNFGGFPVGCVEVLEQTNDTSYNYQINSFSAFTGCSECETYSESVEWWEAKNCNPLIGDSDKISVITVSGLAPGDIVKVNLGTTYLGCYELIDTLSSVGNYSTLYYSDTETPYSDCETCRNEVQIGLSIASCSNNEHSFVNVNLSDYETIIGGIPSDFPQQCIRIDNSCFYVVNDCILTPSNSYNTPTISQFSFSCGFCTDGNLPRSANTETIICEQVCISGGSGGYTVVQVVPPHPVWTDAQGTEVTQLNAVALGGMFGLNS